MRILILAFLTVVLMTMTGCGKAEEVDANTYPEINVEEAKEVIETFNWLQGFSKFDIIEETATFEKKDGRPAMVLKLTDGHNYKYYVVSINKRNVDDLTYDDIPESHEYVAFLK